MAEKYFIKKGNEKVSVDQAAARIGIEGMSEEEQNDVGQVSFKPSSFNFNEASDETIFLNRNSQIVSDLAVDADLFDFNYHFNLFDKNDEELPFIAAIKPFVLQLPIRNKHRSEMKPRIRKIPDEISSESISYSYLPFKSLILVRAADADRRPRRNIDYPKDGTKYAWVTRSGMRKCSQWEDVPVIFIKYTKDAILYTITDANILKGWHKTETDYYQKATYFEEVDSNMKPISINNTILDFAFEGIARQNSIQHSAFSIDYTKWQKLPNYDTPETAVGYLYIALQGAGGSGSRGWSDGGAIGHAHGGAGGGGGAYASFAFRPADNPDEIFYLIPGQNVPSTKPGYNWPAEDTDRGTFGMGSIFGHLYVQDNLQSSVCRWKYRHLIVATGGTGGDNDVGYKSYPGNGGQCLDLVAKSNSDLDSGSHAKPFKYIPFNFVSGGKGGKSGGHAKRWFGGTAHTKGEDGGSINTLLHWSPFYNTPTDTICGVDMNNTPTYFTTGNPTISPEYGWGTYGFPGAQDVKDMTNDTYSPGGGGGASVSAINHTCSSIANAPNFVLNGNKEELRNYAFGYGTGGQGAPATDDDKYPGQTGLPGYVAIMDVYNGKIFTTTGSVHAGPANQPQQKQQK